MREHNADAGVCTSVFRSASAAERTDALNRKWTELINRLERQSGTAAIGQNRPQEQAEAPCAK